ncbi:putative ankyrin repeat protein RF_0381 [Phymastichus coffea]|uniref:putative ankyrin repeat protein RF_0381 n=1 Tax=Phymastichus coffea TaxID=108790 RepID=UPI00273ADD95|nr:putative ankyrin repeat protein RF_0381 [Phymastichus coffea]
MFNKEENGVRSLCTAMQDRDIHQITNILRTNSELIRYKNQLGENLLHLAVKYNFEESIELLIKHGLNIDSTDSCNRTPLHFAITFKNESIVKCLLKHNPITNTKNLYGKSPFHLAVNFGDRRIIQLLLTSGVDVMDTTLCTNQTSLHIVLRNEDEETFKLLLKNYSGNVNIPDAYGETLLHSLARQRNENLAKLLIDRGADVNYRNNDEETALHLAIHRRNFSMCKLLVKHSADVNLKNKYKESALHLAIRYKDFKLVEMLLSFNADINQRAIDNDTMLHVAVKYYKFEVVDLLIKNHVEIDAKNCHGLTPFHTATKIKCIEAAAQLLLHNIDVNTVAFGNFIQKGKSQYYTPLHTAIAQKDLPTVRFLLDNGASFDQDREIFLAVEFGCVSIVDLLVQRGANVNARNSSGRSLLYIAMKTRDRSKVERLLHRGADSRDIDEADIDSNETALHLAVKSKDENFVKFLLDIGIDVNICDVNGMTPLCLANGNSAKFIVASVALLKVHGFFVCKKNEIMIDSVPEFASFFTECMEELEKIKVTRYGNVSLIKFLRDDVRFWGRYVRKCVFKAKIDENLYPIYWGKLLVNIDNGLMRWNLIKRAKNILCEFHCFQSLYDVLDEIVDNFNDDELRNFNEEL